MFEFQKQIQKLEGRFPTVVYSYIVRAISDKAKLSFSKWNSGNVNRYMRPDEIRKVIRGYSDLQMYPLVGTVKIYEDEKDPEYVVKRIVVRKLASAGVPYVSYKNPLDSFSVHTFENIEVDEDFKIEIDLEGKFTPEPQQAPVSFDDIKALK